MSLDERYGRRPRTTGRRPLVVALGVFVALALAWAAWVTVGVSRSSVTVGQVAVDASDPALVRLSFDVSVAAGRTAVCAVRATDAGGSVVGWADVPAVPTASGTAHVTAELRTSLPATGGGVSACLVR